MLISIKRKMVLLCCLCFMSQILFAHPWRTYTIVKARKNDHYPHVGFIKVNDEAHELEARVLFPDRGEVNIRMAVQGDHQTITMHLDTLGRTFNVAPPNLQRVSPLVSAIAEGAGFPSHWFANPHHPLYQFRLPATEPRHRIVVGENILNRGDGVSFSFDQRGPVSLSNMTYRHNDIMIIPGSSSNRSIWGRWERMTDVDLLHLFELLVLVLISPQLGTGYPSGITDARWRQKDNGMTPDHYKKKAITPAVFQGYALWVLETIGWVRQLIAGPLPQGFSNRGGYGLIVDGPNKKICKVEPFFLPLNFYGRAGVSHSTGLFPKMNTGAPPQNCRDGGGWHNPWGYGRGPGSGLGGGSGAGGSSIW